jgi:hypothetical protein
VPDTRASAEATRAKPGPCNNREPVSLESAEEETAIEGPVTPNCPRRLLIPAPSATKLVPCAAIELVFLAVAELAEFMLGPVTDKLPREAVLSASPDTEKLEPMTDIDPLLVSTTAEACADSTEPVTVKVPVSLDIAVPEADSSVPVNARVAARADAPVPSAEGPVPTTVKLAGLRPSAKALAAALEPVTARLPSVAVDVAVAEPTTEGP